jgi:undecaprenyl-diphosphatase
MESAAQVIGNTLVQADKAATLYVNSLHTPWSDAVWVFFSNKWVWVALYALVLYFLFRRLGWKKALVAVAAIALTIVCCDQGANLFKNWICRLRPSHDAWMLSNGLHLPGDAGGLYGFFSGHAANSFGFAAASLGIFRSDARHSYKAYGWAIFIWAFLVSLSRIFLGRHFFGDILVGAAVGMLIGWLFALLYGRIADRL